MSKIAEFLTHFDDQHLANLQCAAEDGTLVYRDPCNCLLHHCEGQYSVTKWEGEGAGLARQAEDEFFKLGGAYEGLYPLAWTTSSDARRRENLLPLIQAEWHRRLREELAKQINEEGEFAQVSPSVR